MKRDDLKPECQRIRVTFGIRAKSLVPEEVTSLLGIGPSHAFAMGEEYASHHGIGKRPWGVWQLRTEKLVPSLDLKDHLIFLLEILEPKRDLVLSFINNPDYYVDVRITWEGNAAIGSFGVPNGIFARLSSLCRYFNFSLIAKEGTRDLDDKREG